MTLDEIKQNIEKTINGKEIYLVTLSNSTVGVYPRAVREAMCNMLQINIDELQRILNDLNQVE